MKKICMISSGGGHLMELMRLKAVVDNHDFYIITEKNEASKGIISSYRHYFLLQQERRKISLIFKLFYNSIMSIYILVKESPDVIITTGAGVTYPTCLFSKIMRKKIIYIESFARSKKKSLTGTMMYPIADYFFVQWEDMLKYYPKAIYHGTVY